MRASCGNKYKDDPRSTPKVGAHTGSVKSNATLFPGELELEKRLRADWRMSRKLQRSCWEARKKRGFNPRGLGGGKTVDPHVCVEASCQIERTGRQLVENLFSSWKQVQLRSSFMDQMEERGLNGKKEKEKEKEKINLLAIPD
jgi:hypothetical protein